MDREHGPGDLGPKIRVRGIDCIGMVLTNRAGHADRAVRDIAAQWVAGVQATVQQVGAAVGVAVIGMVFFGLSDRGLGVAFAVSAAVLGALMIMVGLLARLLPSGRPAQSR